MTTNCGNCGDSLACKDTFGHVHLFGEFCSRSCLDATMREFNLCIGCDGENLATASDRWCDECRNIARVDGIPALPVDVAWIDDNDGCGPRKLSASVRCF